MDREIECQDCNNTFTFTEQEQAFYSEKGFTDPKRCKPCRDVRKARQNSGDSGGGYDRPQRSSRPERREDRPMFDATCAECGASTQVPFEPKEGRPIYCRDCFRTKSITNRR